MGEEGIFGEKKKKLTANETFSKQVSLHVEHNVFRTMGIVLLHVVLLLVLYTMVLSPAFQLPPWALEFGVRFSLSSLESSVSLALRTPLLMLL
jgi:hypothetical protein